MRNLIATHIKAIIAGAFSVIGIPQAMADIASSETEDTSLSEKHLQEITVMADRGWVEDGKIVFLPSKSEKNLSNSPASLIESMHLPMLRVKDGAITSMSGDNVSIFINGVRANQNDLATFWPKLAKRVEYIENSPDPKYQGNTYVVNFIMTEYEVGGITKGDIGLRTPSEGNVSIASKLVYKKMTFGATFSGSMSKDDKTEKRGKETYKNLFYNGTHFDEITRDFHEENIQKERNLNAALNARYTNGSFIATHTVSLGFRNKPEDSQHSRDSWTPSLFTEDNSFFNSKAKSFSPQIMGEYQGKLSEKWAMWGGWSYAHSHNTNNSLSKIADTEAIESGSMEDANSLTFEYSVAFLASPKWIFQINTNGSINWFDTHYSGYSSQNSAMTRGDFTGMLRAIWKPTKRITATLLPGINFSEWSTGDLRERLVRPTIRAALSVTASSKLSLNLDANLTSNPPNSAYTNPVLSRQSEILWVKGNPYLKGDYSFDSYFSASYIPKNWIDISAFVSYSRTTDFKTFDYTAMPQEYGGILKTPYNASPEEQAQIDINARFSLLNNTLTLSLGPQYNYYRAFGKYAGSLRTFSFYANAAYTLKNCRFSLTYHHPREQLFNAGMERFNYRNNCDFYFTYGNGNLYLSAYVLDIFNTRSKSWTKFQSNCYDIVSNQYGTGRKFGVSLTYTFGYGKKVDQSIDISGPQSVDSSILR